MEPLLEAESSTDTPYRSSVGNSKQLRDQRDSSRFEVKYDASILVNDYSFLYYGTRKYGANQFLKSQKACAHCAQIAHTLSPSVANVKAQAGGGLSVPTYLLRHNLFQPSALSDSDHR